MQWAGGVQSPGRQPPRQTHPSADIPQEKHPQADTPQSDTPRHPSHPRAGGTHPIVIYSCCE